MIPGVGKFIRRPSLLELSVIQHARKPHSYCFPSTRNLSAPWGLFLRWLITLKHCKLVRLSLAAIYEHVKG